jgi:S-adenosylmethionine decarboxylase
MGPQTQPQSFSRSFSPSAPVGREWLIDAEGCSADRLRDLPAMREVCARILEELALHVVGQGLWHQFPGPGGVTGLYLLTESHLACHTYPEAGAATFNLYCCRSRPAWPWRRRLAELLGAKRVRVRSARRGGKGDRP